LDGDVPLGGLIAALDDLETDVVPVGLLHHQSGHLEQGIGTAAELDLAGQGADATLLGREGELDRDEGFRTEIRTTGATARTVAPRSALGIPSDAWSAIRPPLRARSAVAAWTTLWPGATVATRAWTTKASGPGATIATRARTTKATVAPGRAITATEPSVAA
jgi:hypothetical protein